MRSPEDRLIEALKDSSINLACSLPCEKIRGLLERIRSDFFHVPLTREEEGVGIGAGAALAGRRAALFVQSSGIGNMINALLSLTAFYELPLAIFVSQRGVYKERIPAQVPMGSRLPRILRGAGVPFSIIAKADDIGIIERRLSGLFRRKRIHVFLLSPAVFEGKCDRGEITPLQCPVTDRSHRPGAAVRPPRLTRYEILKALAPLIASRAVVCNLGFPSKELYHIQHRPSHFYMLGSMGMATPIGLGVSLSTGKEVVVIDGDGSILMNPGSLATAAHCCPPNLTIVAIDNGSYGSTGDQPTLTGSCVDLSVLARGFGIRNVIKASGVTGLKEALRASRDRFSFIHVLALPGNRNVENIPLHYLEVKKMFMGFLKSPTGARSSDGQGRIA